MPLSFGAAITDRVDMGNPASLCDPTSFTMIGWFSVTSLAGNRVILQKGRISNGGKQMIYLTSGNLELNIDRVTTDLRYTSNSAPVVVGRVQCFAATFNAANAANTLVHLYAGDLVTPLTECTYSATTDGSGAYPTDNSASDPFRLGNTPAANASFLGLQFVVAYIFAELTLTQLREWQYDPRPMFDTRGLWWCGRHGTTVVVDASGRSASGLVTGPTVAPDLFVNPLRPFPWPPAGMAMMSV